MYRGLIHFHSCYSYDSILSIKNIVSFAIENDLNFLILTDHDNINGSKVLKNYIEEKKLEIEVLIASEYNTEYGDIIALNIKEEIKDMQFESFIKGVKRQNGVLLFPHPYKGHKNIKVIASNVDMIEAFNARIDDINNDKALILAKEYNKPIYYATDAHNFKSLKNAIIEFKKQDNLINSLLNSKIFAKSQDKSYLWEIYLSQYIKSFKQRNIKLFLFLFLRSIKNFVNLKLFRKI